MHVNGGRKRGRSVKSYFSVKFDDFFILFSLPTAQVWLLVKSGVSWHCFAHVSHIHPLIHHTCMYVYVCPLSVNGTHAQIFGNTVIMTACSLVDPSPRCPDISHQFSHFCMSLWGHCMSSILYASTSTCTRVNVLPYLRKKALPTQQHFSVYVISRKSNVNFELLALLDL